jgi:alkyl hydroperoxide reductase subunit AhpC
VGDPDHAITRNYGMLNQVTGVAWRGIVTVGEDGCISYRASSDLPIGLGVKAALRQVRAARAGITPPDWQPSQPGQPAQASTTFNNAFSSPLEHGDPGNTPPPPPN